MQKSSTMVVHRVVLTDSDSDQEIPEDLKALRSPIEQVSRAVSY